MADLGGQKGENDGQKKCHAPNPYGHGHFAKKRVQIGQFWPPQPHLQSTPPYMGLPPCAIFHNPDDREI